VDRRQFHRSAAVTAAALAAGPTASAATAIPTSLPPDPLPPGAATRLGSNRLWHQWPASNPGLNDLTFSPDGQYLATLGYQDDHVFVWSVADGRAVRDWEPQEVDRGGDLRWTDRGLYVASNGGLSLWEPLTATLIHRFNQKSRIECCSGLAVSADGRWVATTSFVAGGVRVWETATYKPVAEFFAEIDGQRKVFPAMGDFLLSVALSRCGRWLAAGGYTGATAGYVHLWDIAARRHLMRFPTGIGPVGRLAFTPMGQLLTTDWFGGVGLWDPFAGRAVGEQPRAHTGNIYRGLAATSDGRIAVQRDDGVYLWDPDPARAVRLCPGHGPHLAYSDDGRFVAVGLSSGKVSVYDAATGADLSPPDRQLTHVDRIEVAADGTICLASLGYPGPHHIHEVVLRDLRTGARLAADAPADWRPLALAPVGTRIAGRSSDSRLAVWDWSSGAVEVHPDIDPRVVAWHPDGQTVLVAAADGAATTWRPSTGAEKRQPLSSSAPIVAVAVAADNRAAALTEGCELFVWQIDRDDPPRRLAVPGSPPKEKYMWSKGPLALAPDGSSVAVTFGDGIVYAGPTTGDELRAVYTHPPGDEGCEDGHNIIMHYTPAGRLLIAGPCTALRDNRWQYTGVVTDGTSGEEVWRSPPQRMWAVTLALTPDGRTLLTGHDDGTVLVWPLAPG
jgi:WD40 repeat protein